VRIDQALAQARAQGVDRLDAQWLLGHLLGRPRAWLLAHDDALLTPGQALAFEQRLQRRAAGEPLAYVLGEWTFCGLRLAVSPAVLIPRPETEVLVSWADACLAECLAARPARSSAGTAPQVVDLGTGSGAIALALAQHHPSAAVTATDTSAAALSVAAANGRRLGLPVTWQQGDWWAPLLGRRFELAVANPPYVAGADPHLPALAHEPRGALTPEGDGMAALQQIISGSPTHLAPGGWLLLEHGHDQAAAVQSLMAEAGFQAVATRADLAGLPRCTGGRWPGAK
jgi:release factor glutamine methyltransferase